MLLGSITPKHNPKFRLAPKRDEALGICAALSDAVLKGPGIMPAFFRQFRVVFATSDWRWLQLFVCREERTVSSQDQAMSCFWADHAPYSERAEAQPLPISAEASAKSKAVG